MLTASLYTLLFIIGGVVAWIKRRPRKNRLFPMKAAHLKKLRSKLPSDYLAREHNYFSMEWSYQGDVSLADIISQYGAPVHPLDIQILVLSCPFIKNERAGTSYEVPVGFVTPDLDKITYEGNGVFLLLNRTAEIIGTVSISGNEANCEKSGHHEISMDSLGSLISMKKGNQLGWCPEEGFVVFSDALMKEIESAVLQQELSSNTDKHRDDGNNGSAKKDGNVVVAGLL